MLVSGISACSYSGDSLTCYMPSKARTTEHGFAAQAYKANYIAIMKQVRCDHAYPVLFPDLCRLGRVRVREGYRTLHAHCHVCTRAANVPSSPGFGTCKVTR